MRTTYQGMDATIAGLRSTPGEWHRRGLRHPAEVDALIRNRVHVAVLAGSIDPTYGDFFTAAA